MPDSHDERDPRAERGTLATIERTPSRPGRLPEWTRPVVAGYHVPVPRLAVALALLIGITVFNPGAFGWALAVSAMIAVVPVHRLRSFAVAFIPYGAAWLIFTLLRSYADETSIPLQTDAITAIERALFFGVIPTIWLQNHLYDPLHPAWYDYLTTFIHWSYFFVPHVMAVVLWLKHRELFRRYLLSTILLLFIGLLVYFLSPAEPPWLTASGAPEDDIFRVMATVGRQINSSLYDRTYSAIGDPNPIAAMPSMHQAITFLVALFALKLGRWWGIVGMTYALAMAFSLVYTGEHYVLDALVGSALALYCYYLSGQWLASVPAVFRLFRRDTPELHERAPRPLT